MKKMLVFSAVVFTLLISSSSLFAQLVSKGDTLFIGPLHPETEQPLGALNYALKTDTTETGERAHKVYVLERNAQYILTEVIDIDKPLLLMAYKPDDENRPPIIRCGLRDDGSSVDNWWHIFADVTFKNLWMSGINLDGTGPISWITQTANVSGIEINYDGCILEAPYTWWAMFADWGGNNVYKITNCVFQYVGNPTGTTWNGAIFHHMRIDSVIIRNTTFFDFGAFAVNTGQGTFYTEVDHCSFVNCVVHPVNSHRLIQAKFTNNLFVNCHAFSDDYDEIKRHYDGEVKGLMNYAEIQWDPQELDSLYGPGGEFGKSYDPNGDGHLTVDELAWTLKNNNWYYTQDIKNYWNQFSNVVPNPWMNNYNKAMFASRDSVDDWSWDLKKYIWADSLGNIVDDPSGGYDTLHIVDSTIVTVTHKPFKYFYEEGTMNVDPGIVDDNGCGALLAQNCINIRKEWEGDMDFTPVKWHNVDDYLAFTWPLDYDLAYTNSALENAGTDGKPIGSLQWWPEYDYTSIEKKSEVVPGKFTLEQNYPNPFNPTTTISFSVPKSGDVTLTVYNMLGQKVRTLVSEKLNAGTYRYKFDASNLSSGVYIYQINVGNSFNQSKKMILLK